jgi:hypothetical protein
MDKDLDFMQAMREYAKLKNGALLSDEFLGKAHPYKWVCFNGHQFVKTYWELKDHNKFCKTCFDLNKGSTTVQ